MYKTVFRLAEVGISLTSKLLRGNIFTFCENSSIRHHIRTLKQKACHKWSLLCQYRHSDDVKRFMKLNMNIVPDYIEKLHKVMADCAFIGEARCINTVNDKGYMLILQHQKSIYSKIGLGKVHLIPSEHDESISFVGCGSASGQVIPCTFCQVETLQSRRVNMFCQWQLNAMAGKGSMTWSKFGQWCSDLYKHKTLCINLIISGAKFT